MKKNMLALPLLTLAMLGSLAAPLAQAAEEDTAKADPGRWFKSDETPEGRYQNLQKEANAAYGEALAACKGKRGKDMRTCRSQARDARKDDMQRAVRIREDYQHSLKGS